MTQPSQPQPVGPPAPKGGRGKLIAAIVAIIVILVVIAVVVVYYYGQTTPTSPSTRPTIKVGFTISETGTFNVEGTNSLNGIKTMQQWINDHGGVVVQGTAYNITLDYYDDASDSSNIVSLYTSIVQQDGAQFLLAPYSSGLTTAAAPIADQYNKVMMTHGGAAYTIWTKTSRKILVEVLSPASVYLKSAIDWLHANHPTDKIAALYASDSFSTLCAQSAIAYAQSLGMSVVYNQSYSATTTDLSTQLNAAKAASADDLIGGGHFNDGLLVMNQLKTIWTPKFVSLLVAVTEPTFQTQLGATSNNVTGPSQWETSVSYSPSLAASTGYEWFGPTPAQFTTLYGNVTGGKSPSYHSAEAGASLLLLADAIQKANSFNTTAVRAALGTMKVMTYFGDFQINSQGLQIAHTMVLDQWQAATLKVVYPDNVAVASLQYPYTGS